MYEYWYDYIKPKYQNNTKLCYMDADSFIVYIKTEDFYKDISDDIKNYNEDDNRLLPRGMSRKITGLLRMN